MDLKTIARPASSLLAAAARHGQRRLLLLGTTSSIFFRTTSPSLTPTRGHKTESRNKRALKLPPHDSFLPSPPASTDLDADMDANSNSNSNSNSTRTATSSVDTIIYNPPASQASLEHTPFLFLPPQDPRRAAIVRMRSATNIASSDTDTDSPTRRYLPPEMRYMRRADNPRYHLTAVQVQEMRELRQKDPLTWSVRSLARRFDCSHVFVSIAAPAPESHIEFLAEQMARRRARWGPKRTAAREERQKRTDMMYRGQL